MEMSSNPIYEALGLSLRPKDMPEEQKFQIFKISLAKLPQNKDCYFVLTNFGALLLDFESLKDVYYNIDYRYMQKLLIDEKDFHHFVIHIDNSSDPKALPATLQVWSQYSKQLISYIQFGWKSFFVFQSQQIKDLVIGVTNLKDQGDYQMLILPKIFGDINTLIYYNEYQIKNYQYFIDQNFKASDKEAHNFFMYFPVNGKSKGEGTQQSKAKLMIQVSDPMPISIINHIREKQVLRYYLYSIAENQIQQSDTYWVIKEGTYYRRNNLQDDKSQWEGYQMHIRTKKLEIYYLLLRRRYIPPLMDEFQDILITFFSQDFNTQIIPVQDQKETYLEELIQNQELNFCNEDEILPTQKQTTQNTTGTQGKTSQKSVPANSKPPLEQKSGSMMPSQSVQPNTTTTKASNSTGGGSTVGGMQLPSPRGVTAVELKEETKKEPEIEPKVVQTQTFIRQTDTVLREIADSFFSVDNSSTIFDSLQRVSLNALVFEHDDYFYFQNHFNLMPIQYVLGFKVAECIISKFWKKQDLIENPMIQAYYQFFLSHGIDLIQEQQRENTGNKDMQFVESLDTNQSVNKLFLEFVKNTYTFHVPLNNPSDNQDKDKEQKKDSQQQVQQQKQDVVDHVQQKWQYKLSKYLAFCFSGGQVSSINVTWLCTELYQTSFRQVRQNINMLLNWMLFLCHDEMDFQAVDIRRKVREYSVQPWKWFYNNHVMQELILNNYFAEEILLIDQDEMTYVDFFKTLLERSQDERIRVAVIKHFIQFVNKNQTTNIIYLNTAMEEMIKYIFIEMKSSNRTFVTLSVIALTQIGSLTKEAKMRLFYDENNAKKIISLLQTPDANLIHHCLNLVFLAISLPNNLEILNRFGLLQTILQILQKLPVTNAYLEPYSVAICFQIIQFLITLGDRNTQRLIEKQKSIYQYINPKEIIYERIDVKIECLSLVSLLIEINTDIYQDIKEQFLYYFMLIIKHQFHSVEMWPLNDAAVSILCQYVKEDQSVQYLLNSDQDFQQVLIDETQNINEHAQYLEKYNILKSDLASNKNDVSLNKSSVTNVLSPLKQ